MDVFLYYSDKYVKGVFVPYQEAGAGGCGGGGEVQIAEGVGARKTDVGKPWVPRKSQDFSLGPGCVSVPGGVSSVGQLLPQTRTGQCRGPGAPAL